jgi:UDP-N-acetylmuramyl pentapeptide phosphotransferase/UDP-N-acetylglucosamine-1-phosphate transferase
MPWSFAFLGIASFGISFVLLPIIIRAMGQQKGIPPMGGMAIFGTLAVFFMSPISGSENTALIFSVVALLFVAALLDDLRPISAKWRLLFEFCLFTYLIFVGGYRWVAIEYEDWGRLALIVEVFVAVFLYLFLVNAFNFIDGIDGLASVFVVAISSICGWWLFNAGDNFYASIAMVLSGSILGFLPFNWGRAKIYLGDSGILISALLICLLFSRMVQLNELLEINHSFKVSNPYLLILGLVFFPVFDAIRVICKRIINKKSPLNGDKSHLHYEFSLRLKSSKMVVLLLTGMSAGTFVYFLLAHKILSNQALILSAIILWLFTTQWLLWRIPLRKKMQSGIN